MKKYFYISFIGLCTLLILTGCEPSKVPFKKIKTMSIKLPYAPENQNFFIKNNVLYFYTYNYSTYKQLDIYNEQGVHIKKLDLKHLFMPYGLQCISVTDKDTVYVLATDVNILYLLNGKSEVQKKLYMDNIIKKHIHFSYPFRLYAYSNHNIIYEKNIALRIANDKPIKENENVYESQIQYNQNHLSLPSFTYIFNFLDTNTKAIVESPPIMSKFMKQNEYFPILINSFLFRDTLYFYATFHNKLVRYNSKTLEYIDEIEIESDYTKLKYPIPTITEQNIHKVFKAIGPKITRLGSIMRLGFNPQKEYFYVYVSHQHPEYDEKKDFVQMTNFDEKKSSIIVYDKRWKKITEYLIPDAEKEVYFLENGNFITYNKTKNPRNVTLNFYQWTK